jgi:hypothetical protein
MYLIKLIGSHGIESCGYAAQDKEEMESYCARVMANLSMDLHRIMVYSCSDEEWNVQYAPPYGLSVYVKDMKLFKEINVGSRPKFKREHIHHDPS